MTEKKIRRRTGLMGAVLALSLAVMAPGAAHAAVMIINAGDTALSTRPGSEVFLTIPGDLTPPDLLPVIGVPLSPPKVETELVQLDLTGNAPIFAPGGSPIGNLTLVQGAATPAEPADTIVRRGSSLTLPNPGDTGTIPIELVELHLQSVQPLVLNGLTPLGAFPVDTFFDVFIDIDLSVPPLTGLLNVLRTGETTGLFSGFLQGPARVRLHEQGSTAPDSFFDVFVDLNVNGSFETASPVPAPGGSAAVIAWGLWLALWRRRQVKKG